MLALAGLPASFGIDLEDGPGDRHEVVWDGAGPTTRIDVVGDTTTVDGEPVHLEATVDGIPADLTVLFEKHGDDGMVIDATTGPDQAIGSIEAGVALGDATIPFQALPAYAHATTDGEATGAAVRIPGITHLGVDTRDPFVLAVDLRDPVTFVGHADAPQGSIDVTIADLPASTLVTIDSPEDNGPDQPSTTTLDYEADGAIGRIDATVDALVGPDRRPVTAVIGVAGVPDDFDVDLTEGPGEHHEVVWHAEADIDRLDLDATTVDREDRPVQLEATVENLPQDLRVTFDDPVGDGVIVEATAGFPGQLEPPVPAQEVGSIEAGIAVGATTTIPFQDHPAYAFASDRGATAAAAVGIADLEHFRIDTANPLVLDVGLTTPVPLVLHADSASGTVDVTVADLPAGTHLEVESTEPTDERPASTAVDYLGTSGIGAIDGTVTFAGDTADGTMTFGLGGLPDEVHLVLTTDEQEDRTSLEYHGSSRIERIHVDGKVAQEDGPATTLVADVSGVPQDATLTLDGGVLEPGEVEEYRDGADRLVATWRASDATDSLGATIDTTNAKGAPVHAVAQVERLAPSLDVTVDKVGPEPAEGAVDDRVVVLDATSDVVEGEDRDPQEDAPATGLVDVQLTVGEVEQPRLEHEDGANVTSVGGTGLAARVHGLRSIHLDTRDPLVLGAGLAEPVAFVVDHTAVDRTVHAEITDLQTTSNLRLDAPDPADAVQTTVVHYDGSGIVGLLHAHVVTTGDDGTVTDATVDLEQLPIVVDVTVTDDEPQEQLHLVYGGASVIDRVHALVTSTPDSGAPTVIDGTLEGLPASVDVLVDTQDELVGRFLHDRTDVDYRASARLGSLDVTRTSADGPVHVTLTDVPARVDATVDAELIADGDPDLGPIRTAIDVTGTDPDGNPDGIGEIRLETDAIGDAADDPGLPGLVLREDVTGRFVQIPALHTAHLGLGAQPLHVQVGLDPDFAASIPVDIAIDHVRDTELRVHDLPSGADLLADFTGGRVEYRASAPIALLEAHVLDVIDPIIDSGPLAGVKLIDAVVGGLPADIVLNLGALPDGTNGVDVNPVADGPAPTIGHLEVMALSDRFEADDDRWPDAGFNLEVEDDRAALFVAIDRFQHARVASEEKLLPDGITPFTETKAELDVAPGGSGLDLDLAGRSLFPPPTPQDTAFQITVDVPIPDEDGQPSGVNGFTQATVDGGLPAHTEVTLEVLDESFDVLGDGDLGPMRAITTVDFSPAAPAGLHLWSYQHDSDGFGGKRDFELADISQVPTHIEACSGIVTGVCTSLRSGSVVVGLPRTEVDLRGRGPGQSTRVAANGPMRIDRFLASSITCDECDPADGFDPTASSKSLGATFTRLFGIVLPAPATADGLSELEVDTFTPTMNNGILTNKPEEVGTIHFNTDGQLITIEAGEAQTIDDGTQCVNRKNKASRVGIGRLTQNDDPAPAPFTFSADGRVVLFRIGTVLEVGNRCTPDSMNCLYGEGSMAIVSGEIVADVEHPGLTGLNEEIGGDSRCLL